MIEWLRREEDQIDFALERLRLVLSEMSDILKVDFLQKNNKSVFCQNLKNYLDKKWNFDRNLHHQVLAKLLVAEKFNFKK